MPDSTYGTLYGMGWLTARLDHSTRKFWRVLGRPVDLTGAEQWLAAPTSGGPAVGDGWLQAAATELAGTVHEQSGSAGLLADMAQLDGTGFRAAELCPEIRDFYQHTSDWRMEVWTQWTRVFQPAGELVSQLFGRRVQQLALPTRPLDVARGMDSRVIPIVDAAGDQLAAGWIRTLRSTGEYVYSGCYSTRLLPGSRQPSVHVAFPLEAGNVQVFLRPRVLSEGALELSSTAGGFGDNGAYVVVEDRGHTYAAPAPIHETFRVYLDDEGVVRTDHLLCLWRAPAVRLHYKLTRAGG